MSLTAAQIALIRQFVSDEGTNEVQSIEIKDATGGTFTVSYGGQTTAAVAYNAAANVLQNALCALSTIGVGNLTVNGTAPYTLYFASSLGNTALSIVTVADGSLTPVAASAEVLEVTTGGVKVFSDTDLDNLYAEADSNFNLAICYAFRVLLSYSAKFNDYTAGQTKESKDQIFQHLVKMEEIYRQWAQASQQVLIARLMPQPPRERAWPRTVGVPATSLSTQPPNRPSWMRRKNGIQSGWGDW